jgi:hypothetical protein
MRAGQTSRPHGPAISRAQLQNALGTPRPIIRRRVGSYACTLQTLPALFPSLWCGPYVSGHFEIAIDQHGEPPLGTQVERLTFLQACLAYTEYDLDIADNGVAASESSMERDAG